MKTKYYRIGQSLPPRHWYQRRVGWFGKALTVAMVISVTGAGSFGYILNRQAVQSFAAQTSGTEKLHKVTTSLTTSAPENIIDVQFVLDKWAEENKGQKWSVVARSVNGPAFEGQLLGDKQYESVGLQKLLLPLPLFDQIPADQHKNIALKADPSRRSMQTCVDLMLRLANDACASALTRYIDFTKATDQIKKAGLTNTALTSASAKSSAADLARYVSIMQSDATSKTTRDTVMKLLHEQPKRGGIPSGCPGCTVANSPYSSPRLSYDAAVVSYRGGSYILVIMTDKGSTDQIGRLAGKIQQKILDTTTN